MDMLMLKRGSYQTDGTPFRYMRYRQRQYYRSEQYQDIYIKKTQDLWLLGPAQSGKTSAIERMHKQAAELWPQWPQVYCPATDPLGRWTDQAGLASHLEATGQSLKKLSSEQRIDALLEWVQQTRVVLLLDDAHALSGRKLVLAVRLAQNARLVVIGALSEQALHPSIRTCLQRRAPQVYSLRSESSYDATVSLVWVLLLLVMAAGWWELAAALSSARALGYGPLATRQR